jgi:hypothetical protein
MTRDAVKAKIKRQIEKRVLSGMNSHTKKGIWSFIGILIAFPSSNELRPKFKKKTLILSHYTQIL